VILDARTGADAVPDPGLAPTQVLPGYGLITNLTDSEHQTQAYAATG
jgi:hypothetical protein